MYTLDPFGTKSPDYYREVSCLVTIKSLHKSKNENLAVKLINHFHFIYFLVR